MRLQFRLDLGNELPDGFRMLGRWLQSCVIAISLKSILAILEILLGDNGQVQKGWRIIASLGEGILEVRDRLACSMELNTRQPDQV